VSQQYRFPTLLGDDTVLDEVDIETLSAEQLRKLIREAEFVVVRMPDGAPSLETPDSLTEIVSA
jgi:hypothetical protein